MAPRNTNRKPADQQAKPGPGDSTEDAAKAATIDQSAPTNAPESAKGDAAADTDATAAATDAVVSGLTAPENAAGAVLDFQSLDAAGQISALNSEPSGMLVRITGPKKGRWRCGRRFGPQPVEIPLDDLSESEAKALGDDPALSVEVIVAPT